MDSPMKLRMTTYQICGGWLSIEGIGCHRFNNYKVEAIRRDFGDGSNCAIMAHFKCEQHNLQKEFPKALILSSNRHAEGVDLHKVDNLIIYSMDFSTSRFTQRRARQANMKRDTPIKIHFYLFKGGLDEAVYKTVGVKKENFIKNSYDRWIETSS
jgi:hypothetical protein